MFMGHALMDNGDGPLMDLVVNGASFAPEREAVGAMLADGRKRRSRPRTMGADRGYDTRGCVGEMRFRGVTPHVARRVRIGERR